MALYYSEGRISDMSEVKSGKTESGYEWQRMTLTLEVPGINGSVYKQVFNVSGDHVNQALLFSIGDKVKIGFSFYAREWNGKWYNNVDLITITDPAGAVKHPSDPVEDLNPANHDDLPWDL